MFSFCTVVPRGDQDMAWPPTMSCWDCVLLITAGTQILFPCKMWGLLQYCFLLLYFMCFLSVYLQFAYLLALYCGHFFLKTNMLQHLLPWCTCYFVFVYYLLCTCVIYLLPPSLYLLSLWCIVQFPVAGLIKDFWFWFWMNRNVSIQLEKPLISQWEQPVLFWVNVLGHVNTHL